MADLDDDCGREFFRVDDELRLSWIKDRTGLGKKHN